MVCAILSFWWHPNDSENRENCLLYFILQNVCVWGVGGRGGAVLSVANVVNLCKTICFGKFSDPKCACKGDAFSSPSFYPSHVVRLPGYP